jgi:hypothetical protein
MPIRVLHYTGWEIWGMHVSGLAYEHLSGSLVVIEPDGAPFLDDPDEQNVFAALPAIFVSHVPCRAADVIVPLDEFPLVAEVCDRTPLAAQALVLLLRGSERRSVFEGLVAESTTYSMLQAGPEFREWLATRRVRPRVPEIGAAIEVEDRGSAFVITLKRPHVHNAFSRKMRDELSEALTVALTVAGEKPVTLQGAGPSFCSGGDLSEFGTFASNAESHVTRLQRSPARLLSEIGSQVTVLLHGACMGAGIEIPAYAGCVTATADTTIALPEISLGLVPGAGGTWSIPRRIGRQRTAWLALTGRPIDADTSLDWGLVDAINYGSPLV